MTTVGSAKDNTIVLAGAPAHLMTIEIKDNKVVLVSAAPSLTLQGHALQAGEAHPVIGAGEEDADALTSGSLRLWAIEAWRPALSAGQGLAGPCLETFSRIELVCAG